MVGRGRPRGGLAAQDRRRQALRGDAGVEVVDTALDLTGGAGVFKRSRLEQLFRDVRLGRIHPVNRLGVYETVAKAALGLDPDEMPRWG